jgi:PAS domain S-box-containing protein
MKGLDSSRPFTTIASRLLLGFIAIALLPALIISSVSVISSLSHSRKQILNQLESVAALKEAEIGTWLTSLSRFIPTLMVGPKAGAKLDILLTQGQEPVNTKNDLRERFRLMIEHTRLFEEIFLSDSQGRVILSTDKAREGHILKHQTFFRQGLLGSFFQPPIYSPTLRRMIVIAALPVLDREGQSVGVIAGQASISTLNEIMNERTGLGESGETYLVGVNYAIITKGYPDSETEESGKIIYARTESTKKAIEDRGNGSGLFQGYRGKPIIGVYRWIPELQMALLAEQAQSEAFQDTYYMLGINIIIAVISVLFAFAFSLSITRSISNPLANLVDITKQITSGDRKIRAPVIRNDEIGILAHTFNNMVENIQKTEAEILHLQQLLQNITDSMPSALITLDAEGRVLTWNPEAETLTGQSAKMIQGQSLWQTCPELERYRGLFEQVIREKQETHQHKEQWVSGSGTIYRDINIYPLVSNGINGAVLRVDNITRRVQLEEMMIQSEKMMSVGGLAAGMAHEINNPLAGILQNIQVIRNRVSPGLLKNEEAATECGTNIESINEYMEKRDVLSFIEMITESGRRAANIVENMLSFSRKSESTFIPRDITLLLDKAVELAGTDYDLEKKYDFRKIEILRKYDTKVPLVPCDPTKIQQVFLNILKNGAEAINIVDEEGFLPVTETNGKQKPTLTLLVSSEERMVRIELIDNGPGMPEEIRKRIFEPFFTTKGVGAGTGLGLSVSYFIVTENHKGTMAVESTPGKGTKFIIRLPCDV